MKRGRRPYIRYNISATYTQPRPVGKLSATLTFTGQSKKDLYPASKQLVQVTQLGYGLLDGRIGDIDSLNARIAIFGRNLTAKHYLSTAVGLESIGWNAVAPGEPRVVGIQLPRSSAACSRGPCYRPGSTCPADDLECLMGEGRLSPARIRRGNETAPRKHLSALDRLRDKR